MDARGSMLVTYETMKDYVEQCMERTILLRPVDMEIVKFETEEEAKRKLGACLSLQDSEAL